MWFLREQAKFNLENEERKRVLSFLDTYRNNKFFVKYV
mgnify:CR=1 FL=1